MAYSCKDRSFCPSCTGRRAAQTAAHLVDACLPVVPVRQWVLSVPFDLCYRLARRADLQRKVRTVFIDEIERYLYGAVGADEEDLPPADAADPDEDSPEGGRARGGFFTVTQLFDEGPVARRILELGCRTGMWW